jgi:hypothetical protein
MRRRFWKCFPGGSLEAMRLTAVACALLAFINWSTLAQSPTTGRIAGLVKDQNGGAVVRAEAVALSRRTGELRKALTDEAGYYAIPLLPPGIYQITIAAIGFASVTSTDVAVVITETTELDADLSVASLRAETVDTRPTASLIQVDGPQLGRVVDDRAVSELPLATRNFFQILALSPGADCGLADNTGVGRNSQNISVNGARRTQNNFQLNGVDANTIGTNSALFIAVPAPETIQEFKVQTSLYDASFGRSGGGNVQAMTKSGGNVFHGAAYEYFRDDKLNANNPFLKAAGVKRPVLDRNVFGMTFGGPIKKDRSFLFVSYQGTRERNDASPNSISSAVLVANGLTDDRSEQNLRQTFNVPSIHPVSLALLNARLPDRSFLIPTPQPGGRYSGSARSVFTENQFNANVDYRINQTTWLTAKVYFANAPWTLAMFNGPNVPGFEDKRQLNHRLIALQAIHTFNPRVVNETRLGYNSARNDSFPQEPLRDSDFGIQRPNADIFPGLSLFRIAPNARGVVFGTGATNIDLRAIHQSVTVADIVSVNHGRHTIRTGAEILIYRLPIAFGFFRRGQIDFNNFTEFLTGRANISFIGSGIDDRNLRATDYAFFIQDDWKPSARWTINLGLRYELDLPFYDTRGRASVFDPTLYQPRLLAVNGVPQGPPIGGFVQAGNVIASYDVQEAPNDGKRLLNSVDPNNFAPRVGFAYAPLASYRFVLRGGYGIFYSRGSSGPYNNGIQSPPAYVVASQPLPTSLQSPFFPVPRPGTFPQFVERATLTGVFLDRNLRTPYFHQYNGSAGFAIRRELSLEIAYAGTRGVNLPRQIALNQARLASPQQPIINDVLRALNLPGAVITANTPANASLRAPFQGVSIPNFSQSQNTGQSNYNALQVTLTREASRGLRFLAAYTYARSIDNASGRDEFDFSAILGNQLDNRANRGVSDFDRTHRFVLSYLWDLPQPRIAKARIPRALFSNWQLAGIITTMSGQPIDIVDTGAGSFYGLNNGVNPLARPNWAPGATRSTATSHILPGFFFNPSAFARPSVAAGQFIPSSNGAALASTAGTDLGSVGRNVLRGPPQSNVDLSFIKRFPLAESKNIEVRAEFFNLFNHVNLGNPISDLNAVAVTGSFKTDNPGQIDNPGDFGRITAISNNPRLIQLALKFNF